MGSVNGAILWQGETCLPGETGGVVCIVTGINATSENDKTGAQPQVWYLPTDEGHLQGDNGAVLEGRERAVCGDCRQRPSDDGGCYVNIGIGGPAAVYAAWKRGIYPRLTVPEVAELLRGKVIRFGAWGDPACIPLEVYDALLPALASWEGYTHQWTKLPAARWGFLMASVDHRQETIDAREAGYRRFRVIQAGEELEPDERVCPASAEAGHRLSCLQCRACNGWSRGPSRTIVAHGFRANRFMRAARQLRLWGRATIKRGIETAHPRRRQ